MFVLILSSRGVALLLSIVCCVFRSIEDLQKQNEKLLAVVRELSEEQEEKERETVDVQTKVGGEGRGAPFEEREWVGRGNIVNV